MSAFIMDDKTINAELLDILKRINYAFYVEGTSKALKPIMAETKAIIQKAEGRIKT